MFSAKGQGAARAAGQADHMAARDWWVHGGGVDRGGTVPVHRSLVDRGRVGGVRAAKLGQAVAGARAGSCELAVAALRGVGRRTKGTGGLRVVRRGRCARRPRQGKARAKGPHGGGGSAAVNYSGEVL